MLTNDELEAMVPKLRSTLMDDIGYWEPCEFWDEDGCYCVCGANCSCGQIQVIDTGDELHHILGDALAGNTEKK